MMETPTLSTMALSTDILRSSSQRVTTLSTMATNSIAQLISLLPLYLPSLPSPSSPTCSSRTLLRELCFPLAPVLSLLSHL